MKGLYTYPNIWIPFAPSSFAASTWSVGMVQSFAYIMRVKNGKARQTLAMIAATIDSLPVAKKEKFWSPRPETLMSHVRIPAFSFIISEKMYPVMTEGRIQGIRMNDFSTLLPKKPE